MVIRIATLNSRGGNSKTDHLIKYIKENKVDVLMIQEIHDVKYDKLLKLETETKMKLFISPGTQNSRGVMTLVKENEIIKNSKMKSKDNIGNHLVIEVEIDGTQYEIVNIYAPMDSKGRSALFSEVHYETHQKPNRIVGGDFNNIEHFDLDCLYGSKNNFQQNKTDRIKILEFKHDNDYIDIFRQLNPSLRQFTFTGLSNYKSRLDRIYTHTSMINKIKNTEIVPCYFSDHDMFLISVKSQKETNRIIWGKGLWKCNTKILRKKQNLNEIMVMWNQHRKEKHSYENLMAWWETGKTLIKNKCIEISKINIKRMNQYRFDLMKLLNKEIKCTDKESAKRVKDLKQKLKEFEDNEIEGAVIRSRVQWQAEGEKCTRFFFNLERQNGDEKQITEMKNVSGIVLTKKEEILQYTHEYFKQAFTETGTNKSSQNNLLNSITKRLTNEQRSNQAGPFKVCELEYVKKGMKLNKSPGNDGITFEFYKQCWNFISSDLLEVLNEISSSGTLPRSMTQAIITLIFKNKGNRNEIKNWRAISLCNVDYKFLTGLIAGRLAPVLPILTNSDQACAINGRFIEDQLIYMHDMISYIEQFGGKSMIVGLDLQAAFDKIDHRYLHKVLQRMNIGFKIRNLLKSIYDNMYSAVFINGAKTPYFQLSRSIRQGDKISMACFVLAIEPLANIIRQDSNIHPVILPNTEPRCISQYCDDTTIFSTRTEDLNSIQKHMTTFEEGAGATFNASKTEVLLVGKWNDDEISKIPTSYKKESVKFLGVWFGKDSTNLNNNVVLQKIDKILNFWKSIYLSFEGKRLIIMTKILPQLYHIIRIIGLNKTLKKNVQTRITNFIWHPKKMKMIRYDILTNSKDKGGLEMPVLDNINKALLSERIPKVLKGNKIWAGQFIYRMGISLREINKQYISPLYAHTFIQTDVTTTIISTYRKLVTKVVDWKQENFASIKEKLHKNTDFQNKNTKRDFKDTWREINNSTANRRRKDISFLIAHGALPIATVLANRGISIDEQCKLCKNARETFEHLFIKCDKIQGIFSDLEKIIKHTGRTLSEEEILYHEGRVKMKKKSQNIIAAFKQTIWQVRAKLYYNEIDFREIECTLKYNFSSKVND